MRTLIKAVLVAVFATSAHASSPVVDEVIARHQQIRLDGLTKCLKDGTKAMQAGEEWDNDACYERIMTFKLSEDEFTDKVSISTTVKATEASGNIYPMHLMMSCSENGLTVSIMTKYVNLGENWAPFQYRIGKQPAKTVSAMEISQTSISASHCRHPWMKRSFRI